MYDHNTISKRPTTTNLTTTAIPTALPIFIPLPSEELTSPGKLAPGVELDVLEILGPGGARIIGAPGRLLLLPGEGEGVPEGVKLLGRLLEEDSGRDGDLSGGETEGVCGVSFLDGGDSDGIAGVWDAGGVWGLGLSRSQISPLYGHLFSTIIRRSKGKLTGVTQQSSKSKKPEIQANP